MGKKIIIQVIVALFVILWVYTGYNKLVEYEEFRITLGRSPFIQPLAGFIAVVLPTGELLLALLLVIPKTRLLGLYLSFVTMTLFTGYIWLMLQYASDLPCSCGGVLEMMDWDDHLLFNAAFTVAALVAIVLSIMRKRKLSIT
ncbi:hypothetical protein GFS24_25340 [Chitinophaga sp. SYP-B3965]|uniref:MauE/DoxX family redox-associated membrane protein n=1 Tax=Chitinophaga sp. SYP-B3965 TaxID=2663120 RepID=UPI00129988A0|nr:MauE/DoxX family redox-associated membrane protein [Chitinophaga sp. SYP-B3965]MRG48465.1 hypothetical protein [Chitinophaga sp. SYP-B3965]